jgi:hypothetical protein
MRENRTYGLMRGKVKSRTENEVDPLPLTSSSLLYCLCCDGLNKALAMQMTLDGFIEGPRGEMDWLISAPIFSPSPTGLGSNTLWPR